MFQTVWQWLTPDKIVAIATAVYAVVTVVMFTEIRRQAKAARDQAEISRIAADAAKQSAEALVNTERALIVVELVGSPLPQNVFHTVKIANLGRTLAHVVGCQYGWASIDETNPIPDAMAHQSKVKTENFFLRPDVHDTHFLDDRIDIPKYFGSSWSQIESGAKTGVFQVIVNYLDIILNRPRRTTVTYAYSHFTKHWSPFHNLTRYE